MFHAHVGDFRTRDEDDATYDPLEGVANTGPLRAEDLLGGSHDEMYNASGAEDDEEEEAWPLPDRVLAASFGEYPARQEAGPRRHSASLDPTATSRETKIRLHRSGAVSIVDNDSTTKITSQRDNARNSASSHEVRLQGVLPSSSRVSKFTRGATQGFDSEQNRSSIQSAKSLTLFQGNRPVRRQASASGQRSRATITPSGSRVQSRIANHVTADQNSSKHDLKMSGSESNEKEGNSRLNMSTTHADRSLVKSRSSLTGHERNSQAVSAKVAKQYQALSFSGIPGQHFSGSKVNPAPGRSHLSLTEHPTAGITSQHSSSSLSDVLDNSHSTIKSNPDPAGSRFKFTGHSKSSQKAPNNVASNPEASTSYTPAPGHAFAADSGHEETSQNHRVKSRAEHFSTRAQRGIVNNTDLGTSARTEHLNDKGWDSMSERSFETTSSRPPGGWQSSLAMSSLNRAYSRINEENRSLKAALRASEKRCAELLTSANQSEISRNNTKLEPDEREMERLKTAKVGLEDTLIALREELAREKSEKMELIKWKSEWLDKEQQNMGTLRDLLNEKSNAVSKLEKDLEASKVTLFPLKVFVQRARLNGLRRLDVLYQRRVKMRTRRCLQDWQNLARMEANREKTTWCMSLRQKNRRIRSAFGTWNQACSTALAKRRSQLEMVETAKHKQQVQLVWIAWRKHFRDQKRLKEVVSRAAVRYDLKLQNLAWIKLTRHVSDVMRTSLQVRVNQLEVALQASRVSQKETLTDVAGRHNSILERLSLRMSQNERQNTARIAFTSWNLKASSGRALSLQKFFFIWCVKSKVQREANALLRRAALSHVFELLSRKTEQRRHNTLVVNGFVRRSNRSLIVKTWYGWKHIVLRLRTGTRRLDTIVSRKVRKLCSLYFNAWATQVEQEEHTIQCCLSKIDSRKMREAFQQLVKTRSLRKHMRAFFSRSIRRMERNQLSKGFSRLLWNAHVSTVHDAMVSLDQKKTMIENLEDLLNQAASQEKKLRASLLAESLERHDERLAFTEHVLRLWEKRRLSHAFRLLLRRASQRKSHRNLLESLEKRITKRVLISRFQDWKIFVQRRNYFSSVLRKFCNGVERKRLGLGFYKWHRLIMTAEQNSYSVALKQETANVERLTSKLEFLQENHLDLAKRYEEHVTLTREQRDRLTESCTTILTQRLSRNELRTTIVAWKKVIDKKKRRKLLVSLSLARNAGLLKRKVFQAWKVDTHRARQHRLASSHIVAKEHQRYQAVMFKTWASQVQERRRARSKVLLFLRRRFRGMLYRHFMAWHYLCQDIRRMWQKVSFIVAKYTQEQLASRFRFWKKVSRQSKAEQRSIHQAEVLLGSVAAQISKGTLGRFFYSWRAYVGVTVTKRTHLYRFMARRQIDVERKTFEEWVSFACMRQRQRVLMHRLLARANASKLRMALSRWCGHVIRQTSISLRESMGKVSYLEGKTANVMEDRAALENTLSLELSQLVDERNYIQDLHDNVSVQHHRHVKQSRAFLTWKFNAKTGRRQRQAILAFVRRCQSLRRVHTFTIWLKYTHWRKRKRMIAQRGFTRINRQLLSTTLSAWVEFVGAQKSKSHGAANVLSVLRHRFLRRTLSLFHRWKRQVAAVREEEIQGMFVQAQLDAQQSQERTALVREQCLEKAIKFWEQPVMLRTFLLWKSNAFLCKVMRSRLETVKRRRNLEQQAWIFRRWYRVTVVENSKARVLRALVRRWHQQLLSSGLRRWAASTSLDIAAERREQNVELLALLNFRKTCAALLSSSFHSWRRNILEDKKRARAARTLALYLSRTRNLGLESSLGRWKFFTLEKASSKVFLENQQETIQKLGRSISMLVSNACLYSASELNLHLCPENETEGLREGFGDSVSAMPEYSSQHLGAALAQSSKYMGRGKHLPRIFATLGSPSDWGSLGQSLSRCASDLFSSDAVRVFQVVHGMVLEFNAQGEKQLDVAIDGTGITTYVAKTGEAVALGLANKDPRYLPEIDGPIQRDSDLVSKSRTFLALGPRGGSAQSYEVSLVCIPVFSAENAVVGVLQASKLFPKQSKTHVKQYVDLTKIVLTTTANTIATTLDWHCASARLLSEIKVTRAEYSNAQEELCHLRESNKEYERYVSKLKKKTRYTDHQVSTELKNAYETIQRLEADKENVYTIDNEVRLLLEEYDHSMELSAAGGLPLRWEPRQRTVAYTRESDPDDLRQLELEQRDLAVELGETRSRLSLNIDEFKV